MTRIERPYAVLARQAIDACGAPSLVGPRQTTIVLERIARAAGAPRWYAIRGRRELAAVVGRLHPGSTVSLYFDNRISARLLDDRLVSEAIEIIRRDGDVFFGRRRDNDIEIEPSFVDAHESVGIQRPGRRRSFSPEVTTLDAVNPSAELASAARS